MEKKLVGGGKWSYASISGNMADYSNNLPTKN